MSDLTSETPERVVCYIRDYCREHPDDDTLDIATRASLELDLDVSEATVVHVLAELREQRRSDGDRKAAG